MGLGEFIALACAHSMFRLTLNNHVWTSIKFHMQYKFLHIQMVVSFGTIISHWRGLYCHSIDRCLYLRTHIIALLCHLVTTVGECKLWTMASEIQLNTCIQLHTMVGSTVAIILIIINDPATHCWSKQSMYPRKTIVLCTESGLPVERQPLWTKKTIHRIAQQVLSHWVKRSNSHNSSHKLVCQHAAEYT